MRARVLVFMACPLALVAAGGSCAPEGDAVNVGIAPGIVFPRGLLDKISTLTLKVYDASNGVSCEAPDVPTPTGQPTGPVATSSPIATKSLASTGCKAGFKFCDTLQISRSGTDRVFVATGQSSAGDVVASGCTRQKVDQDSLEVVIKMIRFVPPAVCGDGIIEPTETCDPPNGQSDPACTNCQTSEFLLSNGTGAPGETSTGAPGDKTAPFFLWPPQGPSPDRLVAFFTDKSPGHLQVTLRLLSDSFVPTADLGPAVRDDSIYLPNDSTGTAFPPTAEAGDQELPSAVVLGQKYFVAFDDDAAGTFDIHVRSMDASLNPEQPRGGPCGVNGANGAGEPGAQTAPSAAAGPNGALFVAWQDDQGNIAGRTYTPQAGCGKLGVEQTISQGSSNKRAVVAGAGGGWVVAWQSGSDIKMRLIGAGGAPAGAEQLVSLAHAGSVDHPSIAALGDGRFAITWNQHAGAGAIFVQRYDASGTATPGDQAGPVNDATSGRDEASPAIAGTDVANGAYVVAWVDTAPPNQVRARFVAATGGSLQDNSGFLFNTVNGQASEFQVSLQDNRPRANPTIAVGGAAPFIGFGWEDKANDPGKAGIIGRRFPAPAQ